VWPLAPSPKASSRLIASECEFRGAHPSRVLAEASRLGELCAWSRRNARQRLKVRAGGTPNTVWISSGFEIRGRLAFAPAAWSAPVLSFHYPQIESRACWRGQALLLNRNPPPQSDNRGVDCWARTCGAPASGERTRPRVWPLAPSPKASSRLIASECEFREAHPSRVLAEASRLGELCAWSRRNARQRLKVRAGGTPNTVWISSGFEIRGRLAFAPAAWSAAVLSFHYPQIESRAQKMAAKLVVTAQRAATSGRSHYHRPF